MSAGVKKVLNRGGLVAMIVGVVAITVGGGDTGNAIDVVGQVASIAGTVMVLVREVFN